MQTQSLVLKELADSSYFGEEWPRGWEWMKQSGRSVWSIDVVFCSHFLTVRQRDSGQHIELK